MTNTSLNYTTETVATEQLFNTPRAIAEDILLIAKGGGFITDDNNLDERQVLFWISDFVSEQVRMAVEKTRGLPELIDNRLWTPICLTMVEATPPAAPLKKLPKLFGVTCLPRSIMSLGGTLLVRDVLWGDRLLAKMHIASVRQGSAAYSRFGVEQYGWAAAGPTLYATLPVTADANQPLSALAVLTPDKQYIIDHADEPVSWLPEWDAQLRRAALEILGMEESAAADQVNNGADKKSDKR